jgi:hypothetical protein
MKKLEIKSLTLNKKSISNFTTEKLTGGLNYTHPRVTVCTAGCSGSPGCHTFTC